ncbi:hypothetical protein BEWA_029240 [Theileria equi strain WA]|uniref:Uncharacterized protein n=1 Tax=Theileria equi strain WA TaxID=1537102 RepID=L0AYV3_THEEQ|nr:hypothetical protein BEWA_029240 [Theileria equi strain WA]AFZ80074.1 hypothetical protein BEWA_029240 [Theileria equi strain WA]|eukprot:XP_004829740.1 hypothetical protein BEWA_029240 [Theileria equi strain WA]
MLGARFGRTLGYGLVRNRATPFARSVRYYDAKDEYEVKGFRKFIGPFWVITTRPFLKIYGTATFFFLLYYYPLDKYLLGVREIKAELDAKVRK